jgi:hypothetical protein
VTRFSPITTAKVGPGSETLTWVWSTKGNLMFKINLPDGAVISGDYDKDGQPIVIITNVPGIMGVHTFEAAGFIDAARRCDDFCFGSNFCSDVRSVYTVSREVVLQVSLLILGKYDRKNGFFKVVFVNTVGLPF